MTVQVSEVEISAEAGIGVVQISEIAVERDVASMGTIQISEISVETADAPTVACVDFWAGHAGRWQPRGGYSAAGTPRRGNTATAVSAPVVTGDYLVAGDNDAADIAVGDTVRLHHADGTPIDNVTHVVASSESAFGFTNLHLDPVAGNEFVAGDYLVVVGSWG